jgi:hypothetical protein
MCNLSHHYPIHLINSIQAFESFFFNSGQTTSGTVEDFELRKQNEEAEAWQALKRQES